jgi:TetR/AcrR family transcriptional repressor of nem operon
MHESGLTHGGFYGHFTSKEALANEACAQALEQSALTWQSKIAEHRKMNRARKAIVDHYLSDAKRDHRGDACPVVSLSAEISREEEHSAIHDTYLEGLETLISTYMATIETDDLITTDKDRRKAALVEYSLMVGAMTLARAAGKAPLSDEILSAARQFLKNK